MEQITLTDSFVQKFEQESYTFFVGRQEKGYGIVAAGSWETVLPFCFEKILPLHSSRIAVWINGKKYIYHIVAENGLFRAVSVENPSWTASSSAIFLTA